MSVIVYGTYVFKKIFPVTENEKEKQTRVKCYSDKCKGSEVIITDAVANEWFCLCFVPLCKVKSTPFKACPNCEAQLFQ